MRVGAATKRFACNLTLSQYNEEFLSIIIVKLRFRSRSGEAQLKLRKVRKVRYLDLSYTLFLVFNIDSGSLNIDSGSHTNF